MENKTTRTKKQIQRTEKAPFVLTEIPDCMPKQAVDIDEILFYLDSSADRTPGRQDYIQQGMFAFVSWKWVEPLAKWIGNRRCLEIMAGRGWWSHGLRQKGVDVIATDDYSWHQKAALSSWNDTVTQVEKMDALEAIATYGASIDILLVSWAYMDDDAYLAVKALHAINPNALIVYIGEGKGDCTFSDNFFDHVEEVNDEEFEEAASEYEQWRGIYDELKLVRYRP